MYRKVYRFMSFQEFDKLTAGCELVNRSTMPGRRTNSVGFCFLPESVDMGDEVWPPEECHRFLSGIVSEDVLVEFEVQDDSALEWSWGIYANPYTDDWYDRICIDELCCQKYSRDTLRPVRYAMPDFFGRFYHECTWYTVN